MNAALALDVKKSDPKVSLALAFAKSVSDFLALADFLDLDEILYFLSFDRFWTFLPVAPAPRPPHLNC